MTVKINKKQIQLVAEVFKKMPESGNGLNFYSEIENGKEIINSEKFPPLNHPQAINFFFFAVMHDYGFWYGDEKGYYAPLSGNMWSEKIKGRVKGSDLLWMACKKAFSDVDNERLCVFEPTRLANVFPIKLAEILSDADGPIFWPSFEERFRMTRAYGRWFMEQNVAPSWIVEQSNKAEGPLEFFLAWTREIPGYNMDPFFMKKNMLLAMALANRPEKFLKVTDLQNWKPLIDYHLMRVSLRLGIVELIGAKLKANKKRRWTGALTETVIREATYEAVMGLIGKSGRPMSYIDEKMWMGRKYCPEMNAPECDKCIFERVCKKRIELFQPVYRTTNY